MIEELLSFNEIKIKIIYKIYEIVSGYSEGNLACFLDKIRALRNYVSDAKDINIVNKFLLKINKENTRYKNEYLNNYKAKIIRF